MIQWQRQEHPPRQPLLLLKIKPMPLCIALALHLIIFYAMGGGSTLTPPTPLSFAHVEPYFIPPPVAFPSYTSKPFHLPTTPPQPTLRTTPLSLHHLEPVLHFLDAPLTTRKLRDSYHPESACMECQIPIAPLSFHLSHNLEPLVIALPNLPPPKLIEQPSHSTSVTLRIHIEGKSGSVFHIKLLTPPIYPALGALAKHVALQLRFQKNAMACVEGLLELHFSKSKNESWEFFCQKISQDLLLN